MKILVTASSKHGATEETADAIAARLTFRGFDVLREAPEKVMSLEDIDAVVVGSAVYMLQWMAEAQSFVERFEGQLSSRRVWAFSVGMNGVPKHAPQDPSRIGPVLTRVEAVDHKTFPGRYVPQKLSLRERTVMRLASAVEGDFRDWDAVNAWADEIADALLSRD
ncbi:flavodoxin [Schaalia sp. 19OD2882]|uniref:flavodoxin domain-containing protein n=1 Tax=Schaalia sp. 19OD2882 TaxID=2794089 RepID=UPI001C1ED1AF|nr:flavodoxin domain-containing protein [Schaalia sp. 19OD2882]QWW18778.1 flavodoxin [Schaalia sp. 19OD2882]